MTVMTNGKRREIAAGRTLATLLADLGLSPGHVVVERNGAPVHRDDFASTQLREGDRLEIAQMVGGG